MRTAIMTILAAFIAGTICYCKESIDLYLMGFFRDLARLKAKKRLMERKGIAVAGFSAEDMKMLFLKVEDDPLNNFESFKNGKDNDEDARINDLPLYTREELYEYGDGKDPNPILISLFGRIYDVSSGKKFYGPGGKYHSFAGRDVTRALSQGCLTKSCLGSTISNLKADENEYFNFTSKEKAEGQKWVAFFETHDSYSHVGMLKEGQTIEQLIDSIVEIES